ERHARFGPGVRAKEIRMLGDAGPRPPALDLLVASGYEERFAQSLVDHLGVDGAQGWDVIDLAPLRDPSRARAFLAEQLDGAGKKSDARDAATTLVVALAGAALSAGSLPPPDPRAQVADAEKGLVALRRLSRLEWADRDEPSPLADAEATRMLHDILAEL